MLQRLTSHSEVERRERERAEADTLYNDALTALDRALPPEFEPPPPPPSFDEHQLPALNQRWQIIPSGAPPTAGRGLRTRLAYFVWRLVEPYLERQQAFNSILVDHINRSVPAQQALLASVAASNQAATEWSAALARFHSQLILYAQQITLYVDSKDRALAAGLRAVIDALADELLRRGESLSARERRLEDIRDTLATLQQRTLMLKRELERLSASGPAPNGASGETPQPHGAAPPSGTRAVDSYKYVGFEDLFRGPEADVRLRQADYVQEFRGATDVLDVGCGRGEFLDLLREAGISARGLDVNRAMVDLCRDRGLIAEEGDALTHLESLPDASLGGVFAAQVVEHLPPTYLMRMLETAYHKLRPGSMIILETINPACWIAFFESYIRDPTHVQPIHPDTLKYLMQASGFQNLEIRYRTPYPDAEKLRTASAAGHDSAALHDVVNTHNANSARLSARIFSYLDYAAVGVRR
jgi:SAM-dependent methyltransferase